MLFSRCQINRWKISRTFDEDSPLAPQQQKHIEGCESCRLFYQSNQSIVNQTRDAVRSPDENSDRCERIIAKVHEQAAGNRSVVTRPLQQRTRQMVPVFAGAAAACLMLVWLWPKPPTDKPSQVVATTPLQQLKNATELKSEFEKIQEDLSRGLMFLQAAAQPLKVLESE